MTEDFDERADDVRILLETAHVPPAQTDLARAIATGSVIRRRRRYAAVAAATLFTIAGTAVVGQAFDRTGGERMEVPIGETVTSTPVPFSACTVSVLPAPPGGGYLSGQVVADPTGRYAAASVVRPDGTTAPVLWTDGEPQVLPVSGDSAQPRAVNSSGFVVGTATTLGRGNPLAWIYHAGEMTRLAPVDGYEWWAPLSIDERGDVTGEAWRGVRFAIVSWSGADPAARPKLLTRPGDVSGSGVGGGGTVVGSRGNGAAPYAWRAGIDGRALELPPGAATGQALAVSGDWAAGWVALHPASVPPVPPRVQRADQQVRVFGAQGKVNDSELVIAPARWDLRTGAVTHWPERAMPATAVNASGWVALPGESGPTVISPEGRVSTLPGPVDGYPTALSDDNRRLYGERVPPGGDPAGAAADEPKDGKAPELVSPDGDAARDATQLLMWRC